MCARKAPVSYQEAILVGTTKNIESPVSTLRKSIALINRRNTVAASNQIIASVREVDTVVGSRTNRHELV